MHSSFLVRNDHLVRYETLYQPKPRGPPVINGRASKPPGTTDQSVGFEQIIYIVGTADLYIGPDQGGRSIHRMTILDLQSTESEWKTYEQELAAWREHWARGTGLPIKTFDAVYTTTAAGSAAFQTLQHILSLEIIRLQSRSLNHSKY